MATVITTDIFCDGEYCSQWVHGTTGSQVRATEARKNARKEGWHRLKIENEFKDLCYDCYKDYINRVATGTDSLKKGD
ncbi:MAG: hypothetical protein GY774_35520 [Planctomycetes bacterium]|nr:hypothetical protein [Planctomycetota bacterium]